MKKKMLRNKLVLILALVVMLCVIFSGCSAGDGSGSAEGGGAGSGSAADVDGGSSAVSGDSGSAGLADMGSAVGSDAGSSVSIGGEKQMIEIVMENGGVIEVELDAEAAPLTVENFLNLVDEGFYDGLTFHRVIEDFMIQGGDPEGTGMGGADEQIRGEFSGNGWANPISHKRGVISMARSGDPNSASSQFFITHGDSEFLDGQYAAFGIVTSGMEVVDEIAAVDKDANDKPNTPIVIETIRRK